MKAFPFAAITTLLFCVAANSEHVAENPLPDVTSLAKSVKANPGTFKALPDDPIGLKFYEARPLTKEKIAAIIADEAKIRQQFKKDDELSPSDKKEEANSAQVVYLNFKNDAIYYVDLYDSSYNYCGYYEFPSHFYTTEEQNDIVDIMQEDFKLFNNYKFVTAPPEAGDFSTLTFNLEYGYMEMYYEDCSLTNFLDWGAFFYGLADNIDVLNKDRNDNAVIDFNVLDLLLRIDPSGELLASETGLPLDKDDPSKTLSTAMIRASCFVGSHELGHLLGLRHHDSWGPPGTGLPISGFPSPDYFLPQYEGPANADEVDFHILSSGSSGSPFSALFTDDGAFFSERSAIKLFFAEGHGARWTEKEASQSVMHLPILKFPNTLEHGLNSGSASLEVQAALINGRLLGEEVDTYTVWQEKGRYLTIDMISLADYLNPRPFDMTVRLFHSTDSGMLKEVAFNDDNFESLDSLILDYEVMESGTYVIMVAPYASSSDLIGDYQLLMYCVDMPIPKETGGKSKGKGSKSKSKKLSKSKSSKTSTSSAKGASKSTSKSKTG